MSLRASYDKYAAYQVLLHDDAHLAQMYARCRDKYAACLSCGTSFSQLGCERNTKISGIL